MTPAFSRSPHVREPDTSEWNFTSALLGSFERRQAKVFALEP
ncbi:hypothetical protein AB4156_13335 [Cupriavidus sp. 2MCAB6]